MPRHLQDFHLEPKKFTRRSCLNQEIGFDRVDIQLEPETAKEFRIGNHRGGFGMAAELATKPVFDLRHVWNVIEMAMSEEEQFWR